MESFSEKVQQIVMKKKEPDVKVLFWNGSFLGTFECHADVLTETSGYFRAAFATDMAEGNTGVFELKENEEMGITAENFRRIKDMVYSGTTDCIRSENNRLPGVILLANYLQMPSILDLLMTYTCHSYNDYQLSPECIQKLSALPPDGPKNFKEAAVDFMILDFNTFFKDSSSVGYKCDADVLCMILDSEEVHVQEITLLKMAIKWLKTNNGWRHAGEILKRIRYGCIDLHNRWCLHQRFYEKHVDGEVKSLLDGFLRGGSTREQFPLHYRRREKQVAIEKDLNTEAVVGLRRQDTAVVGHIWDETRRRWKENGFMIKNCISNTVVRHQPEKGKKTLVFLTKNPQSKDLELCELEPDFSYRRVLGTVPELSANLWKRIGGLSFAKRGVYLHYCGNTLMVDSEDLAGDESGEYQPYLEQIYLVYHHHVAMFDLVSGEFDLCPELPGLGKGIYDVEKSVNVLQSLLQLGFYWFCFGRHPDRPDTLIMTCVEHMEHQIVASGKATIPKGKYLVPIVSDHDVYILNLTDLEVYEICAKRSQENDRDGKLFLRNITQLRVDGDLAFDKRPPKLLTKDGLTLCVNQGKLYTVYHDCLLDTGLLCDGTTIPHIPTSQLWKNPAHTEVNSGDAPPGDIESFLVLPIGLCRNV